MKKNFSFNKILNFATVSQSVLVLVVCLYLFQGLTSISNRVEGIVRLDQPLLDSVLRLQTSYQGLSPQFKNILDGDMDSFDDLVVNVSQCKSSLEEMGELSVSGQEAIQGFQLGLKRLEFAMKIFKRSLNWTQVWPVLWK